MGMHDNFKTGDQVWYFNGEYWSIKRVKVVEVHEIKNTHFFFLTVDGKEGKVLNTNLYKTKMDLIAGIDATISALQYERSKYE